MYSMYLVYAFWNMAPHIFPWDGLEFGLPLPLEGPIYEREALDGTCRNGRRKNSRGGVRVRAVFWYYVGGMIQNIQGQARRVYRYICT
jgi:hypothetical protein